MMMILLLLLLLRHLLEICPAFQKTREYYLSGAEKNAGETDDLFRILRISFKLLMLSTASGYCDREHLLRYSRLFYLCRRPIGVQ